MLTGKSVSVRRAAELMGKCPQFVREGLKRGILPIGHAIKTKTQYNYYISPKLFAEYTGIKVEDIWNKEVS